MSKDALKGREVLKGKLSYRKKGHNSWKVNLI